MFVVDLITAFLLAAVLTILFASIVNDRHYRRWRDLPLAMWLMALGSWVTGLILVTSQAWIGHWLPFALSAALLIVSAFWLSRHSTFQVRDTIRNHSESSGPTTIAPLYFSVTLLLFFCAISLRFYFENLG